MINQERRTPCAERPVAGTPMAGSCPSCRHASILHPGYANPALEACLVCELEQARDELGRLVRESG